MMLGINAPKPAVKGEFAKAVRKAVRDSMVAKENWKEPATKGPWKVKFVVRQYMNKDSELIIEVADEYESADDMFIPSSP